MLSCFTFLKELPYFIFVKHTCKIFERFLVMFNISTRTFLISRVVAFWIVIWRQSSIYWRWLPAGCSIQPNWIYVWLFYKQTYLCMHYNYCMHLPIEHFDNVSLYNISFLTKCCYYQFFVSPSDLLRWFHFCWCKIWWGKTNASVWFIRSYSWQDFGSILDRHWLV